MPAISGASFGELAESESRFGAVSDDEVVVDGGSSDECQIVVGNDEVLTVRGARACSSRVGVGCGASSCAIGSVDS